MLGAREVLGKGGLERSGQRRRRRCREEGAHSEPQGSDCDGQIFNQETLAVPCRFGGLFEGQFFFLSLLAMVSAEDLGNG